MKATAIIPARLGSTRFPEKPLALLQGKCLINHVWQAVLNTGLFEKVIVATDSMRIFEVVEQAGGQAAMSAKDHLSGSDRVAEIAANLDSSIIVNVQGDEPFITAEALKPLLDGFQDERMQMASLMCPIKDKAMLEDANIVKVVTDTLGRALYFSRSRIPFDRDGCQNYEYMRHIGVYAWRKECLLKFVSLMPSTLEKLEKLEQLRALENGIPIQMIKTDYQGIGIDTLEDLIRAEAILRK